MLIKTAEFIMSNTELDKCPKTDKPEYAFIGRSNVGKSSLINMLTNHSKLAKVSGQPGKTQTINHFLINKEWYLVDLPGYGYAKTSKKLRNVFAGFTKEYLMKRPNLVAVFVLIDSRHEPQKVDQEFMEQLGINKIPFIMVFTKMDKLTSSEINKNINSYKKKMLNKWEFLPLSFTTSATTKMGRDEMLNYIEKLNGETKGQFK